MEDAVDKNSQIVTNISKLSPTHFVSSIRYPRRGSRFSIMNERISDIQIPWVFFFRVDFCEFSASLVINFPRIVLSNSLKWLFRLVKEICFTPPPGFSWFSVWFKVSRFKKWNTVSIPGSIIEGCWQPNFHVIRFGLSFINMTTDFDVEFVEMTRTDLFLTPQCDLFCEVTDPVWSEMTVN